MVVKGPCFFADFERVFTAWSSSDNSHTIWESGASALEEGLSVYQPCEGVDPAPGSADLTLVGSPTDYDARIGDHGAAIASVSKHLDLHVAQALLLLKRWVRSTKAKVAHGWVPTDAQLTSLRCLYASQRWHHLLCMRYAAEAAAPHSTGPGVGARAGESAVDAMPVSPQAMLAGLLKDISKAMEKGNQRRLLTDGSPFRNLPNRHCGHVCKDAPGQATSELCLMLQTMLYLLPVASVNVSIVLEAVKQITNGIGHVGQSAWHDRKTVRGLIPRYAVAGMLHLLHCRYGAHWS